MRFVTDSKFAINDDAYVMYVKEEYKDVIDLKWAAYKLQKLFYSITTGKQGCGTFSKQYAEKQLIEIPRKEIQLKELELYQILEKQQCVLNKALLKLDEFLARIHVSSAMDEYTVKEIFYLDTGRRITKQELYCNLNQFVGRDDLIPIVSSGTLNGGVFGYATEEWLRNKYVRKKIVECQEWVPWKNYKGADFIIDRPCITWNTDGDAGSLFYREEKFYPTDHCGVLILKEEYSDKVNLKYFVYTQKYSFKQNTDRGNLHKEQIARQKFELPDINTQNKIAQEIEIILRLRIRCQELIDKIKYLGQIEVE